MRYNPVTVGPLVSANSSNISGSHSYAGAVDVTLDGALVTAGVTYLDKPRRVLITSAGDDHLITFTIYGTNAMGHAISEALTGATAGNSVYSVLDYFTVTRIATSAATAGAVTVGTNGIASSVPVFLDHYGYSQVAIQCNPTGTVNYTVQQTLDDPNRSDPALAVWVNHSDTNLVGATTVIQGNYAYLPRCMRVLLNSGSGSVKMTVIQAGTPTT
jgi:hypothetical protein